MEATAAIMIPPGLIWNYKYRRLDSQDDQGNFS